MPSINHSEQLGGALWPGALLCEAKRRAALDTLRAQQAEPCHGPIAHKKKAPPSPAGLRSVRSDQRLGCAVAFIGFSVPPRTFHGLLNNPGHKRDEFRNESSDVPGKAF